MLTAIAFALGTASAMAGDAVRVEATLIRASNADAPKDARLNRFEPNLRRIFRFKSYQHYGGGEASASAPSTAAINLGHGNRVKVTIQSAEGNRVEAGINWQGPAGTVLNTSVGMSRGVPVILGGGQQDGGTMIIAITAR